MLQPHSRFFGILPRFLFLLIVLPVLAAAGDEWIPTHGPNRLSSSLQSVVDQSPHQVVDLIVILKNQPAAEVLAEQDAAFAFERESLERRRAVAAPNEAAALNEAHDALTLRIRRATAARLAALTQPDSGQTSAAAAALGATILERYTALNALHIKIPAHAIPSLLAQPEVADIFPNSSQSAQLDVSVPELGADAFWAAGFTGSGHRLAIFDTGVDSTHPALSPASWTRKVFLSGNNTCVAPDSTSSVDDFQGHGTHVAGAILSRGGAIFPDSNRLGVAPQLSSPLSYKISCLNNTGGATVFDSDVLAALNDLLATTSVQSIVFAYGTPAAEDYPPSARMWDYFAEVFNLAVAFPAGNIPNGSASCNVMSPGVAYNAITAAAWSTRGAMNPSGCPGPTLSSRRKPDLAAPGTSINSTLFNWETGPDFGPQSGSSLAAAHIAGSFPLLAQGFAYSYIGPLGARALLVNSTDDSSWAPDRGWGYANLQRAYSQRNLYYDNLDWPDSIHPTARFFKADLAAAAKATLAWNNAVSGSLSGPFTNSGLARLELYAYSPANASVGSTEGTAVDNIRKLSTSASGTTILTVTSQSPPTVRNIEPFALATSVPFTPVTGPTLFWHCNLPTTVMAGSTFSFMCGVNNSGELDALGVLATIHWPNGFTAATTSIDYGTVPANFGTDSRNWLNITAPSTPGVYTINRTIQSASYGANLYFSSPVKLTVAAEETSPTPVIAAGPSFATPNTSVDFSAGAGFTTIGHVVEYQYDWGDGTSSTWGTFARTHAFAAPGTYSVRARTRCATDTIFVSEYSTPRVVTVAALQLPTLPNSGFESGSLGPWLAFGSVSPAVNGAAAYSGSYGLSTSAGSGGVYVDFDGLTPQRFYHFTVRVKASGAAHEGMFWAHDGLGSDGVYSGWRTFSTSQWEQLQINFRATQSGMARLHLETRGATGGLLWDDVQVSSGWVSDMENGTVSPWTPFGAVTAAPASSPANGLYSLALTGSGGAFYDAVGLVPGRWYHVKAKVRVAAATSVRLWLHDTQGANSLADGWYNLNPGAWYELQLNYQANPMAAMRIHIQANTAGVITYWDDVQVLDGWRSDFDGLSGASGWTVFGYPSIATCSSPIGANCLGQTGTGGGHFRDITGLRPGHLYRIRAKIRAGNGFPPNAQLAILNPGGAFQSSTPWVWPSNSSWRQLELDAAAPADGVLRINLTYGGNGSTPLYWDDVEIIDGWLNDFEDGLTAPWSSPYGESILHNYPVDDTGSQGLYLLAAFSGGAARDVTGLIPGQRYHASARVRLATTMPTSVSLRAKDTADAALASSFVVPELPARMWNLLDLNLTAPPNGAVRLNLDVATPGSSTIWDDVQLKEGWVSDFESLNIFPWTAFGTNNSLPASSPAIGNGSLVQFGGNGGVYLDVPNLIAGRRYQISARARSSAGATAAATLWVHDTAGSNASFAVVRTPSPYTWDRFTLIFTATATGKVRIHLTTNGGSGEIYWDEVRLSEGWTSDFDNGQIYGWNSYGATTQALSSAAAIGPISLAQTGGNGGSWQDVKDLIPGQDYLIVARSRSSAGASNQSILWVHDTTGANQIWSVGSTPSPYGWDERRLFYRANSTGAVRLHLANTGGTGTLYWDDIEVVPVY